MATTTTPVSAIPAAPAISRSVGRRLTAATLIGGATLQLIEEAIDPPFPTDAARFDWLATHTTWHAVDIAIGLAAVPLLIAGILILARMAVRTPRLAQVGAGFAVTGFCGLAAVHGFEAAEIAMLDGGVQRVVLADASAHLQPALAISFMAMFLGALTIGLPMVLVALWRCRTVPRPAILLMFVFMIVDFVGPEMPLPSHAISFVGFTWMAVAILRGRASANAW